MKLVLFESYICLLARNSSVFLSFVAICFLSIQENIKNKGFKYCNSLQTFNYIQEEGFDLFS